MSVDPLVREALRKGMTTRKWANKEEGGVRGYRYSDSRLSVRQAMSRSRRMNHD